MSSSEDNLRIIVSDRATLAGSSSLDLPGILPLVLVAATWEFLLNRVVGLAAGAVRAEELRSLLDVLAAVGSFAENFSLLLAFALICHVMISMVRQPSFGPLPHRITVCGFAATIVVVGAAGTLFPLGRDTALLAHAASVLLSVLLILGLSWHAVGWRLLVGSVLLLLPTVLRFYASCAISIPLLRTDSAIPLHAFRAAEALAVIAAMSAPFLLADISLLRFIRRPPIIAMGLAAMPSVALAAALTTHPDQVRELCLLSLGFELFIPLPQVVYPVALFTFLLSVALLVLPGLGPARGLSDQRIGYGMAFLFVAGLDGLRGTVLALDPEAGHIPELVRFLLEGHWEHLNPEHQALVGPPLRDMYQLVILGLGYVLIAYGAFGKAASRETRTSSTPGEEPST